MWICAPDYNPAFAQSGVLIALFADFRTDSHAAMLTLPHEDTPTASHAVMLTNTVAATPTEQHADNSALRHIANAHMKGHQQVSLRTYPQSQLSYNPTPQQEGMRT